jgi:hypothetical protein
MTTEEWTKLVLATLTMLATACDGFDPVGAYEGTAAQSSQTVTMLTDLAPDGTSTGSNHSANSSETGVVATVTRVDDRHLDVALGDFCRVRFEQSPEPNEHAAQVVIEPEQRCLVAVEGFTGDVSVAGDLQLARGQDPLSLSVTIHGSAQIGDPDRAGYVNETFSYTFSGTRSTP